MGSAEYSRNLGIYVIMINIIQFSEVSYQVIFILLLEQGMKISTGIEKLLKNFEDNDLQNVHP